MHFLWTMYLSILMLFSLSLLDKVKADSYDDIDEDYVVNMNTNHTTTVSVPLEEESEETYDYPLKSKTTEKATTLIKNSTKSHHHGMDDYDDEDHAYKNDDDETDLTTTTTLSTSPAEKVKFSTTSTTEITTTKIPVTRSSWSYTRVFDGDSIRWWTTTTMDPAVVAAYIAKTNRDRLYLKIFTISVSVGMISLAIAFITIHMIRKTRRYHGYGVPANASSNKQSKQLNNIPV